jgi:ABC-2 type transport system permease protein
MRTLEKLLTTPISIDSIVLGGILAGFVFGVVVSSAAFGLAVLVLDLSIAKPFTLIASVALGALCFSSMGILISFPATDNPSNVMMFANLVKLPLIFVSGVFVPLSEMPGPGGTLALLSPLTYFADGVRGALGETSAIAGYLDLLSLGVCTVLFLGLGIVLHRRSMSKRF